MKLWTVPKQPTLAEVLRSIAEWKKTRLTIASPGPIPWYSPLAPKATPAEAELEEK